MVFVPRHAFCRIHISAQVTHFVFGGFLGWLHGLAYSRYGEYGSYPEAAWTTV
jgi:hypothetical protein